MYGLTITPPSNAAYDIVDLELAKRHLRIDHDDEDALITRWLMAAQNMTEGYTERVWGERVVTMTLPCFPVGYEPIRLPIEPATELTSLKYLDTAGVEQEMDVEEDVQVWLDHTPPLIAPVPHAFWPQTLSGALKPVTVEFTAGNRDTAPEQVATAILLTLADWDKNREGANRLPDGVKDLLDTLWTGNY